MLILFLAFFSPGDIARLISAEIITDGVFIKPGFARSPLISIPFLKTVKALPPHVIRNHRTHGFSLSESIRQYIPETRDVQIKHSLSLL